MLENPALRAACVAPFVYALIMCVLVLITMPQMWQDEKGAERLALFTAGAWLAAVLHVFALGYPYYLLLKKKARVTAFNILLGGILIGSVTGVVMAVVGGSIAPDMVMAITVLCYGGSGFVIAWLCWRLGLRKAKH